MSNGSCVIYSLLFLPSCEVIERVLNHNFCATIIATIRYNSVIECNYSFSSIFFPNWRDRILVGLEKNTWALLIFHHPLSLTKHSKNQFCFHFSLHLLSSLFYFYPNQTNPEVNHLNNIWSQKNCEAVMILWCFCSLSNMGNIFLG